MNIEIYSIRTDEEAMQMLNNELSDISSALESSGSRLLYKTEMDCDSTKLLEGLAQSFASKDNIDTVIIANALDEDENNTVYSTLCALTSNMLTEEKDHMLRLEQEHMPDLVMAMDFPTQAEPIYETDPEKAYSNAVKLADMGIGYYSYCFFYKDKKIIALPKEELTGISSSQMIISAASLCAAAAKLSDGELMENGIKFVPAFENKSKKKRGFWAGIIPMKGDSAKEIARKIILIIAILTFLITAGYLINYLVIQPYFNDVSVSKIKDTGSVSEVEVVTDPKTKEVVKTLSHDWDKLKKINKEIVAWVKIDDTQYIDYPVLQSKSDTIDYQKYLYADYEGNYSGYGSIFIDFRSKQGTKSKNIILHGHHMQDGRMFQNLMGYGTTYGDIDFYRKHPTIHFDTPDGDAVYKIISVYKTNTLESQGEYFDYLTGTFASDAEFMNYVYLIRERSFFDIPVNVNEDDQLLTLSTCSYELSEFRTVVVARKVRKGESEKVDVKKASINNDALFPDAWYSRYGGTKPEITTFKTAYKAKEIDWYDGSGKLKGKERMFTLFDHVQKTEEETEVPTQAPTPAPTQAPTKEKILPYIISLNYSSITMNNGDTDNLSISWNPSNTTEKKVTWTSSDTNVAKIAAGGRLTAVGPGTATIKAETPNGCTAYCKVKVLQPVETLSLNWSGYNVKVGQSFTLTATVSPSNATNKKLTWKSSNSSVASVNSNGVVTGKRAGNAVITVSTSNGISLACNVTVLGNTTVNSSRPSSSNPPSSQSQAPQTPTEEAERQSPQAINEEDL